jgi:hypothetical protein
MLRPKVAVALFAQILTALVLVTSPAAADDEPGDTCKKTNEGAIWCSECSQRTPAPTYSQYQWTCKQNGKGTYSWEKTNEWGGVTDDCGGLEEKYCGKSQKN